jgi:hypothetical protein
MAIISCSWASNQNANPQLADSVIVRLSQERLVMAEIHHIGRWRPPLNSARWLAAALLFCLIVVFYWRLLLTNQFTWMQGGDIANQVLPWFQMQAGEYHLGHFPLWDPYVWYGQPLIGQAQPGTAYPLNWLLFLLPLRHGWMRQIFLHWYFAGIHVMAAAFAYRLARELGCRRATSLLGGVIFSLSGYMAQTDWPQMLNGAVWAPLVILYLFRAIRGERIWRSAFFGGFFLGVSWLSGHHQIPIFVSLACGIVWLWAVFRNGRPNWDMARCAALFFLVTFAAGALQILPAVEYGRHAVRWVGAPEAIGWGTKIPYDVHRTYGLRAVALLGILFPGVLVRTDPFLGVTALILALLAIAFVWQRTEVRLLAAVGLGGLLYALADRSFLHGPIYSIFPIVEKARNTSTAVFLFGLAAAMLAAIGAEQLWERRESLWARRAMLGSLIFGLAIFTLYAGVAVAKGIDAVGDDRHLMIGVAALLLSGLIAWVRRGDISFALFAALLIALFFTEAANDNEVYLPTNLETQRHNLTKHREDSDIVEFLRTQPQPFRVKYDDKFIPYNFGDWYGIQTTGGYLASLTDNLAYAAPSSDRAMQLLGVEYAIQMEPDNFHTEHVFTGVSGRKVFRAHGVFPRSFIVHRAIALPSRQAMTSLLSDPNRNLLHETYVPGDAPQLSFCDANETAQITAYAPNSVRLSANLGCRGMLILTDVWFPGWQAKIDGKPAQIHEAYGYLRGVVAEAGQHTIEFQYRPASVTAGAALTFAAALAALVLRLRDARRR